MNLTILFSEDIFAFFEFITNYTFSLDDMNPKFMLVFIFKPGVCQHAPGFLKLLLSAKSVCVCLPLRKLITTYYSHEMNP